MAVVGLMGTVAKRLLTSFVFSAESKSLNLGRFGKRSGYLVCCCEILQPNWGAFGHLQRVCDSLGSEVFVIVTHQVEPCLVSLCLLHHRAAVRKINS